MSNPILATKLNIPTPRSDLVPRPRLIDLLNAGASRKLTIVSAPAGYGKTTLLSAWVLPLDTLTCTAWLSLDEGDNDLRRFLSYLTAALQTINSQIGQGVLAALQSPGELNVESLLTILLNDINEICDETVLVFDDYHTIEFPPIDQAIAYLLDHLPEQVHMVISSRIDPSLSLARLRACGQLSEVRAKDLRFNIDEAHDFLNKVLDYKLPTQDIAALEQRTEGWIAGLQLVVLSMRGLEKEGDIANFINSFTGSDRYIQDYLMDEVLGQQQPGIQEFLLNTSILNQLSGDLCDQVTGGKDGGSILVSLEAANLFIVPLDNKQEWYRYHHLFADLLKYRLERTNPELIPILHRRASVWYESKDYITLAFRHALDSGDTYRAAELLEARWQVFVHRGQLNELRRMLDALGPEVTKDSAPLSMAFCWVYSMTWRHDLIPVHLEDVRRTLKDRAQTGADLAVLKYAVLPSLIETMEATLHYEYGDADAAKNHALEALSLIPAEAPPAVKGLLRASAGFWLAQAHRELGELDQAIAVYLDNMDLMKISQNQMGAANSALEITRMYIQTDRTLEAIALCEDMLDYILEQGWDKLPPSGTVYLSLALAQVDVGDFESAHKNLMVGRELIQPIMVDQDRELVENLEAKISQQAIPDQPLIEPLTQRELEVLGLIAQGLSNQEISEHLCLALSTVKGHNQNIFGKLQVGSRTEAVARSHELDLL